MIDWFRGEIKLLHKPIESGCVVSISPDGTAEWVSPKKVVVTGSHENTFRIRSVGGNGRGLATGLQLDGNPSKFLQGHNIFGTNDLVSLVLQTYDRITESISLDGNVQLARKDIEQGNFLVKMIDINEMYDLGTDSEVEAWLHSAQFLSRSRSGRPSTSQGTLYLQKNSRRWAIKFYNKFREINSTKKHRLPAELIKTPLGAYTKGKLRIEVRLMSLELKENNLTHGKHFTEDKVTYLYNQYVKKVNLSGNVPLQDKRLSDMPRAVRSTYTLWQSRFDLQNMLTKSTFYRHRKILMEYGIDITMPPIDSGKTNVVPLIRVVEATPVQVPDWAYNYMVK
ncbi:hypothetical protein BOW31_12745 [Solemya velum gill symbiont]|uniref:phage/plasmid replication protein, II/X family n=1 Tax=Solemya velum gill symbiont TaxID=2340 RepID=UPI00099767A8|nr:phage/plasmid replication protein, II/X family [Solemya velum gill symbiont]OOZ21376.1 hypothetical protein BOW31_12745 [Solemya velum gill symbiont]